MFVVGRNAMHLCSDCILNSFGGETDGDDTRIHFNYGLRCGAEAIGVIFVGLGFGVEGVGVPGFQLSRE